MIIVSKLYLRKKLLTQENLIPISIFTIYYDTVLTIIIRALRMTDQIGNNPILSLTYLFLIECYASRRSYFLSNLLVIVIYRNHDRTFVRSLAKTLGTSFM